MSIINSAMKLASDQRTAIKADSFYFEASPWQKKAKATGSIPP
jgi:hypothetical protein